MAFKMFKKLIKHSFKKDRPVAEVDSSVPLLLEAKDKTTSYELDVALHEWQRTFGLATKDKMLFNDDQSSSSSFKVYFSPYTLECFLNYYKTLIEQEDPVPHMGGNPFRPAVTNLVIYYDTFLRGKYTKDSKGYSRPVLDSNNKLKTFIGNSKHRFASDKFMSILVLLNQLIFFYNYSAAELANGDVDPSSEYDASKKLAVFIRNAYLGEHSINPASIATIPSYSQFERQQFDSVYIPALVSADVSNYAERQAQSQPSKAQHDDYIAKVREKERMRNTHLSPLAKKLKSESDSMAKQNKASAKSSGTSKSPSASQKPKQSAVKSNSKSSNSQAPLQNPFANPDEQPATTQQNEQSSVSSSSVDSESANEQSAYQQSASSSNSSDESSVNTHSNYKSINNKQSSSARSAASESSASSESHAAPAQRTKKAPVTDDEDQMDLVDAHEFAKEKFPVTDKPTVIRGAIQILLDKDPNLFHIPFHFKTFKVDKHLPSPAPIQEAIRTGNVDNQRYVLESDNHYKQIVNDIINNRSSVLDMGYTRMLTDLIYGAYSKLDNKISVLLSQKMNNKPLFDSARNYYNVQYGKIYRKLAAGEKMELQTVNKALWDEYMAKKRLKDNNIQQRYSKRYHDAHFKVNDLANRAMYRARHQRNDELNTQIKALSDTDMRKLHLQITQAKTEYKHRFATVGDKLSSFFYDRIQAHHEKVLEVTSSLIRKQVKLDESRADLRQAKAEVVNSKGNRQAHAKYAREQKKQQAYINELTNEIQSQTDKLTSIQVNAEKDKHQLESALAKNRTLQGQLDNANAMVTQTKQEIAKGKDNLSEMRDVKKRNIKLAKSASAARQDYSEATSVAAENSAKASRASSATSSANQALDIERQNTQSTIRKYQTQVTWLKTKASSAAQQGKAKAMKLKNSLQDEAHSFNDYKMSEASAKASNSEMTSKAIASATSKAASSAKSNFDSKQSSTKAVMSQYQDEIGSLNGQLQGAATNKGEAQGLRNELKKVRHSMAAYRTSASEAKVSSSSAMQSVIASHNSSIASSANAKLAQKLGNHKFVEDQYKKKIANLQDQVQTATQSGKSNTDTLNKQLSAAYNSLSDVRAQATVNRSSIVSSVASSMAQRNEASSASAASHGQQLQRQIADYQNQLKEARASKSNNNSAMKTITKLKRSLASTTQAMSNYQAKMSNEQEQHSIASASNSASASQVTSSYRARLAKVMTNIRQASQTNTDTGSAAKQLQSVRSAFDSYQQSVSNSNAVHSMTAQQQNEHQATSYENRVATMKTQLRQALKSNNKSSGQSQTIKSLKATFNSKLASYSQSFSSYKDSVRASNASAAKSRAKSNRATRATLSSATISNATIQRQQTEQPSPQSQNHQIPEDQGYQGPQYDFGKEQSYNPHEDEVEQQRIQQMDELRKENRRLRENKANAPKPKTKKAWWHL